jgi:ribosomal protein S18 acetylase RimI-like enzyme
MTRSLRPRPFTWDDAPALRALNASIFLGGETRGWYHIGEFYWLLRNTPPGSGALGGMRVWPRTSASIGAAAWIDLPSTADFLIAPDAAEMPLETQEILDWIELELRDAGGRECSIVALDADAGRIDALRRRGYAQTDTGNLRFRRDLTRPIPYARLPGGYTLATPDSPDNLRARVEAENDGFGGNVATFDLWRALPERFDHYRRELDVVVVAADGRGAAGCTGWYEPASRRLEVEAVATAPAHRRLGLAKAAVLYAMSVARRLGGWEAILYTDIGNAASAALYRSCGFEVAGEDRAWVKELR